MSKKLFNLALIFLVISLLLGNSSQPSQIIENQENPIVFQTSKTQYKKGKPLALEIINQSQKQMIFNFECPKFPFEVFKIQNGKKQAVLAENNLDCSDKKIQSLFEFKVDPLSEHTFSIENWSNQLFSNLGTFVIEKDFIVEGQTYRSESNQFQYVKRGIFSKIWNDLIYQPLFNLLILIVSFSPNLNLGIAIIILTLVLRAILHKQNKKAMIAQKKLSKIQPKLNEIRNKYKDDQQKMAQETLKIWSQEKINPLSSLTPMLVQFPILIGLFYVIQGVLNLDNQYLIYDALSHIKLQDIGTQFTSLIDLKKTNKIILPIIVASLQFTQMYMTLPKTNDKTDSTQKGIQNGMLYFMPALIAVVTATLPSGVGLYWGTSTLVGICQQYFINKEN
ncbi:YidC/Oxa1 family membrane protein insertase [bacterium]|jgi:YidC/Oxa1 family membrane protein insertase|nr:YidC/Oxa1 family membrane protein insertase [bacterium]MBT6293288.1 YidC/Oxa1 family membrane protein insertase [bacterium]